MGLITATEYADAVGDTLDPNDVPESLTQAIEWASDIVREYTDRDFGTEQVVEDRQYLYEGYGYLEIDDCSEVYSVKGDNISSHGYYPGPQQSPVFFWIEGLSPARRGGAGDFMINMGDRYDDDGLSYVVVRAKWGWPEVPPAVKQATVWITKALSENPGPYVREDIADYGYSRGAPGFFDMSAIPSRAQDILDMYRRVAQ